MSDGYLIDVTCLKFKAVECVRVISRSSDLTSVTSYFGGCKSVKQGGLALTAVFLLSGPERWTE